MDRKRRNRISVFLTSISLLSSCYIQAQQPTFSEGTEFWVTFMQNIYGASSRDIVISAEQATSGVVEAPLQGWSQPFTVASNGMTTVTVPISLENNGSEVISNKGIRITSLDTVNIVAHSAQMFSLDATSIQSVANLGTEYIVAAEQGLPGFQAIYRSEFAILSIADNTEIEITPSDTTTAGRFPGVPFTITLDRGETYQVLAKNTDADLTGTIIRGGPNNDECRPFAVFGGSMCANIPVPGCSACDHIFQQMTPINTWGTRYFTFDPEMLDEYQYRVIVRDNNTQIIVDGTPVITLNAGQWYDALTTGSHCIEATNPVAVYQMFTGFACNSASLGDPSMILLNTEEQKISSSSFYSGGSVQLSGNRIAIISDLSFTGSITVDGTPVPSANFIPYPSCPGYGIAHVQVGFGQHIFEAPHGAIAYPYGAGNGASYLYSLGAEKESNLPMSDTVFCQAGQVDLVAPPGFIDPYWTLQSNPGTVIHTGQQFSINPSQSDVYIAHGNRYVSGCETKQNFYVEIDNPSPIVTSASPPTLCSNGQSQLDANISNPPLGAIISWSPGHMLNDSTISNPTATISESTWFYVSVQSATGCSRSIDSVFVEVAYPKILDVAVSSSTDTICDGDLVSLEGIIEQEIIGDGFTIINTSLWNSIQGGTSSSDCGSTGGKALYFNSNGNRVAETNGFDMSNGGHLRFMLKVGSGLAPCDDADPGEDIYVEYSTNNGAVWSTWPGSTLNEAAYPTFTLVDLPIPPAAFSANTSFRISQPAHSGMGQDNWAIDDLSISAFSSNNLTLQWSPALAVTAPNASNTNATPSTSTWFSLSVDNAVTGCTQSDSVFVSVGENFTLNMSSDTSLCDPAPVQLNAVPTAGNGHSFNWTPNNATLNNTSVQNPIANTSVTQSYAVSVISDHGCTANDQVTISVDDVHSVAITASDSALCAGQTTQLDATITGTSAGLAYNWGPAGIMSNNTIQNPVASPSNNTNVTVTVTDIASGCEYSDVLPIAVVNLNLDLGPDTVICDANGLQLFASHTAPNPTFTWNGGANLNSNSIQDPIVLLNQSNTYTVTLDDAAGCSTTDQIAVTVPFDNLVPLNDTSFCQGDSAFLDASHPNSSVVWNGSTNANSIWVNSAGVQNIVVTDNTAGCQSSYSLNVTVHPDPVVNLGNDTTICAGQTITLDASNTGSTYLWSNNAQTQTTTVSTPGVHWVEVSNANGCVSRDSIELFIEQIPNVSINDTTLCDGGTVTLNATWPNATYLWSTNANTPSINVSTSGNYSVTVSSPAGCSVTENAQVNFVPFPVVYLGADTTLCDGDPLVLDASNAGLNFSWNDNSNNQTLNPSTSGIYWVDVANGSCVSRDSIAVVFNPIPSDNLMDVSGCEGDVAILSAGNPGSSYLWSTNDTTESLAVSNSGNYSVTVTNGFNCSADFDASVTFDAPPVVDLGTDTVLCEGQSIVLSTGYPGADNDWSNGEIGESITVTTSGTYEVIVSTQHCSVSDDITITFNPSPVPVTPTELRTCLDESPGYVVIDAGNTGSTFDWSTGEQSQVVLAGQYGWYFVNITNNFDCSRSDSVEVIEYCPANIFVPNSFTPNGDGINDVFMAVGNNIVELEMFIFDRWGNQIFYSDDPNIGWDGSYQGAKVKDEVYSWRIVYILQDDHDHTMTTVRQESLGHVSLLR